MTLDVSNRMIEPSEFYRAQLVANKVAACPEDIAKFASARGIPLHTAKLAKLYFEQLALDGVRYADEDARAEDAIKMAKAYFDQAEEIAKTAATVADTAMDKLAAVAAELLKSEAITGVTVSELLKIASLQLDSKNEFELVETAKTAGLKLSLAKLTITDAKLAAIDFKDLAPADYYHGGDFRNPAAMYPNAASTLGTKGYGYTGSNPEQLVHQGMGAAPDDPNTRETLHGILSTGFGAPGHTLESATTAYKANAPGQGSWVGRNSKWLLPTGILGAGAAYLLYRHMKNKDDEKKQQLMSLMSRRQPGMG